ncbi:MAG: DNA recombination protein RmuC [Porticoccaceae bacterium]|jgi:DNA recombination protein RmuC|nr:DNA recombination protein RmuC [Porticoccaceae bacterium]MBT7258133.1 DNA recombination protein RmuC [Porticoccaceae bacterium]MDA9574381.1 DNA recombination protein RmuC [Porticoccaceae bacterium]MDG1447119.1 DNA recombination protein RmuC [Porticoccaceae bacterium]MDG1705887.1 DNA recombination protein RmuC [Porticoccaceae bacterium]
MELSISIDLLLTAGLAFALGIGLGWWLAISRSAQQRAAQVAELLATNRVLEEKLSGQQAQYEAQLKLLQEAKVTLGQEFENLANRIFDDKQAKFSSQSKEALEVSLSPLRRDIGDFRKQVETAYDKENADRNKLAGQISELQKQTLQISADAVSLANALRGDNKAQGNWGEFVLEKLLEDSGLTKGREYDTQVALKDDSGKRKNPDVIVHLPEGRDIVIDAKVSLVDYERYFHAEDEDSRELCLRQHLASLRSHIKGLSGKDYENLEGVNSLDFVLIFVPVEAAFMLALDQDPDMMRDAYDRGIIVVSPSTLMVTLRTIKNLWRYADQNRNAQLIADKAGALYDQFVLYVEALDDVGRHLDKSKDAWDTARKRLSVGRGNLVRRTQELKKLGAKTKKSLPDDLDNEADSNVLEDNQSN